MSEKVYGDKRIYWVWLVQVCGVGSSAIWRLSEKYPSIRSCVEAIMNGTETDLTEAAAKKAAQLTLDDAKQLIDDCESQGISVIYINDDEYPKRLKATPEPPPVLFVKGDLLCLNAEYTAVIAGARDPDGYSQVVADIICQQLTQSGVAVITGLEKGIDITSAKAAEAYGAVRAGICGRGIFGEKETEDLFDGCGSGAVMLAEFTSAKDFGPTRFTDRNRILCGLADAVIFVECSAQSKGLKIAQTARSLGKAVLAVPPADITNERYFGQRELLRNGAVPYFDADDVINSIKNNADNNAVKPDTAQPAADKPAKPAAQTAKPATQTSAPAQTPVTQTPVTQTAPAQTPVAQTPVKQTAPAARKAGSKKSGSKNNEISREAEVIRENVKRALKGAVAAQKKESPEEKKKREEKEMLAKKYEELDDESKAMYQMIKEAGGSMRLHEICDKLGKNTPEVSMPIAKLRIAKLLIDVFGAYTIVEF